MSNSEPARALAAHLYTDSAVFEQEKERVFFRTWQYAGHVSQLERPGDYFTFDLLDQRLFCVKGIDGEVRTFFNVCQHRAHEVVRGSGNKRVLVCPYHAWTYELDGQLRAAPNDQRVPGFDRSQICLTEVRTEILWGFVFVNLNPDAEPMTKWYPGLEAGLREYVPDIERLCPVYSVDVEERCNWKVSVENYSECYHCRLNHPTFANGVIDADSYNIVPEGYCLRHMTRAVNLDKMSYDLDPTANEHALDYTSWFLWPAFSFQIYPGNVLNTYLWRPTDIRTTLVQRAWYSVDGAESETLSKLAAQDRDTTVAEDIRLVESVQRGLESRGYRPSPLIIDPEQGVNSEHSLLALHGWLEEALAPDRDEHP